MAKPIALVLGGYVNALGVVRSLADVGVSSIVADPDRGIAGFSRWAKSVTPRNPVTDEKAFIDDLVTVISSCGDKPVLFATADEHVKAVMAHRKRLEAVSVVPWAPNEVLQLCLHKEKTQQAAERVGVRCPRTVRVDRADDILTAVMDVGYPAILKPELTVGFQEAIGWPGRSRVLGERSDVERTVEDLTANGLSNRRLVIQEFIRGDVRQLYTFTSYSDHDGRVTAWSTGHKVRQYPAEGGTILAGRVTPDPDLVRIGRRLMDGIGYVGIANTEFKRDPSGEFVLIEINPRPGMWNRSALVSGVNLPALAFADAIGAAHAGPRESAQEVSWVFAEDDLYASVIRPRIESHPERLSLRRWYSSPPHPWTSAIWQWNDPVPGVVFNARALSSVVRATTASMAAKRGERRRNLRNARPSGELGVD